MSGCSQGAVDRSIVDSHLNSLDQRSAFRVCLGEAPRQPSELVSLACIKHAIDAIAYCLLLVCFTEVA